MCGVGHLPEKEMLLEVASPINTLHIPAHVSAYFYMHPHISSPRRASVVLTSFVKARAFEC